MLLNITIDKIITVMNAHMSFGPFRFAETLKALYISITIQTVNNAETNINEIAMTF
ncbi:hypothetical protein MMU05_02690 [Aquiflexum sp. AIY15W]|nr:hypothetical protein [Cognataquiflexum rubidum]